MRLLNPTVLDEHSIRRAQVVEAHILWAALPVHWSAGPSPPCHRGLCFLTPSGAAQSCSQNTLYMPEVSHSYRNPLVSPDNRQKNGRRFMRTGCVMFLFLFANKCSLSEKNKAYRKFMFSFVIISLDFYFQSCIIGSLGLT